MIVEAAGVDHVTINLHDNGFLEVRVSGHHAEPDQGDKLMGAVQDTLEALTNEIRKPVQPQPYKRKKR